MESSNKNTYTSEMASSVAGRTLGQFPIPSQRILVLIALIIQGRLDPFFFDLQGSAGAQETTYTMQI